ncbi:Arfaptin-1, variant 2 [Schistosoma haematobium]|uniref:Arfaptin-1, variant 2 n=1 Tax=Schistosoma haematobium TaxID=6185 RepID=A0A922LWE0_SCHHA|nr:Arfaptin-1, variant 2 [Schistosoma haematobium]KAH9594832.1 Arfaptin-1, variant 2 [Schistosoma haematobium]
MRASASAYTTAPSNPPSIHHEPNSNVFRNSIEHSQSLTSSNSIVNTVSSLSRDKPINEAGPMESYDSLNLQNRLENFKHWSVTTFKCTKQMIEEKLGTASVTCDQELEDRISMFRNMHQQYRILHNLAEKLANSFRETIHHQRAFTSHMTTLIVQQPDLNSEFTYNTETQRIVISNGEKLLASLNHFVNSLNTLVSHTFEDTWTTVSSMQSARIQYDAYRNEMNQTKSKKPNVNNNSDTVTPTTITISGNSFATDLIHDNHNLQSRLDAACERYSQLRKAVLCKLEFLQENRLRVMQHQLVLLQNATSAFFSGNNQQLDQILNQYKIKLSNTQNGVSH